MKNNIALSKDIAERDAVHEHFVHGKKLQKVRARIDNRPPKTMPHLKNKVKKELEELKTQAEIQRHNQILLEKLKKINITPIKHSKSPHVKSSSTTRIRIDEIVRIGGENQKILSKIRLVKSYYSARKHHEEYNKNKYLSYKLSENSRRIPRITSYNPSEIENFAKDSQKPYSMSRLFTKSKPIRPSSANNKLSVNN